MSVSAQDLARQFAGLSARTEKAAQELEEVTEATSWVLKELRAVVSEARPVRLFLADRDTAVLVELHPGPGGPLVRLLYVDNEPEDIRKEENDA